MCFLQGYCTVFKLSKHYLNGQQGTSWSAKINSPLGPHKYMAETNWKKRCPHHSRKKSWNLKYLGMLLEGRSHRNTSYRIILMGHTRNLAIRSLLWITIILSYCASRFLNFEVVLIVVYIFSTSSPNICVMISVLLNRVNEWFHPLAIRALFLLKIHDIEGIIKA
jgi:hypothetical protein